MPAPSLVSLITKRNQLESERLTKQAEVNEIEDIIKKLDTQITELMDKQSITVAGDPAKTGTAKISESIVPSVKNWDEFYKFIHRKKYYHLLERRPSVSGCREIFEQKGIIPGVEAFTKRKLTVTPPKIAV